VPANLLDSCTSNRELTGFYINTSTDAQPVCLLLNGRFCCGFTYPLFSRPK